MEMMLLAGAINIKALYSSKERKKLMRRQRSRKTSALFSRRSVLLLLQPLKIPKQHNKLSEEGCVKSKYAVVKGARIKFKMEECA